MEEARESQPAKASMPPVIFFERGIELWFTKVGPQGVGDYQFGIRDLPKKKIADAHFATGADKQIRIRKVAGVEVLGKDLFGDVRGIEFSCLYFLSNAAHSLNNLGASAITQRHHECQTVVLRKYGNRCFQVLLDSLGQPINLFYDF